MPGSSHDSFPSGHATEAFAVASVISARSKSWIIPVIAYSAATIVAIDRGEKEKGVLFKDDLQLVPIRHGLAARLVY